MQILFTNLLLIAFLKKKCIYSISITWKSIHKKCDVWFKKIVLKKHLSDNLDFCQDFCV